MAPTLAIIGIILFAGASFFFALSESALFSLGPWQAKRLAQQSARSGQRLQQLLQAPQDLLATIVLGNTLANAAVVALGLTMAFHGQWPLWWTSAGLLVLILIGCEVVPKTLAVRAPEPWALRVAIPMTFLSRFARPMCQVAQRLNDAILRGLIGKVVPVRTGVTDEEYRELLEMAFQQGTLAASEKDIILQIITLDKRTVREVMKPRSRMACIADDCSVEEMIAAARKHRHRRLPIYDETPDTIVGVLNTRALLLDPSQDLAEVIEFPSFVPASMNLLQLLKSLQRQQRGLAIVLDEYGGTAGLVTIEDILEDMIGEIRGEGEAQGFVMERQGAGKWRLSGTMRLDDFRREYPALGEVPGVETMGGLMVTQMEVVPSPGQTVNFRGLRLTTQVADDRRVRELLVEVVPTRATWTDAPWLKAPPANPEA